MLRQHRVLSGTSAEWSARNPILGEGVPGFESNTGKYKIGDGSSRWSTLSYTDSMGASTQLSGTKLAQVVMPPEVLTITAGSNQEVDFAAANVLKGDDYWNVPGSAADLNVAVDGDDSTKIVLPDDDCQYDIKIKVLLACDVADAGKLVGVQANGWSGGGVGWAPVNSGGLVEVTCPYVEQVFAGDTDVAIKATILATQLTVDATVDEAVVMVIKRP